MRRSHRAIARAKAAQHDSLPVTIVLSLGLAIVTLSLIVLSL